MKLSRMRAERCTSGSCGERVWTTDEGIEQFTVTYDRVRLSPGSADVQIAQRHAAMATLVVCWRRDEARGRRRWCTQVGDWLRVEVTSYDDDG